MTIPSYKIEPIGQVRLDNGRTRLEIHENFRPALEGLNGYSHMIVVFWCHLNDTEKDRRQLVCQKPYTKGPERLGVFATRSPVRPNPVAITPVQVLGVDPMTGTVDIPFIDAEDKTPIIDLKPYSPSLDRVREANTPPWCAHWPQWAEDSAAFDWEAEFSF